MTKHPQRKVEDVLRLADGDHGAIFALMLLTEEADQHYIDELEALGVTGNDIWIGFDDVSSGDIATFKTDIMSGTLVSRINVAAGRA